jgi:sugar O-acyltransferase (sialic acid O-acetyltransferase NeuD family)
MADVVIFGCGRGADTAFRYLSRDSSHRVCAFTVDAAYLLAQQVHGLPVVPYETVESQFPPDRFHMFVPLGFQQMNAVRAARYLDAKRKGYRFISYVHSRAYSLEPLTIGENCFILDGQIINLDVSIGHNVTMWSGNHIGDRTRIGDHVWISSHVTVSGDVTIGDSCFLGVNSCISNHVTLGAATFVGAGAIIAKSTEPRSVHLAAPAKTTAVPSDKFLAMLNLD